MLNPFVGRAPQSNVDHFAEYANELLSLSDEEFVRAFCCAGMLDVYTRDIGHHDLWVWGMQEILRERLVRKAAG